MTGKPLSIADLRREYASRALDEQTAHTDALQQFRHWLEEALRADLVDANAMALATVTPDGHPAVRTVLIKHVDDRGVVFFTHYVSPKGDDLAAHPEASVLFYWAVLERQVRITGAVERVAGELSDTYFATRPRDSQIAAWCARQSSILPDRRTLEERYAALERHYEGQPIPRPPDWGGYLVVARQIEFWQGRPGRLHDRLLYTLRADGSWSRVRLAP